MFHKIGIDLQDFDYWESLLVAPYEGRRCLANNMGILERGEGARYFSRGEARFVFNLGHEATTCPFHYHPIRD